MSQPRRRSSDKRTDRRVVHWFRVHFAPLVRENWYRDVWLTAITVVVLIALNGQSNILDDVQKGRRFGVDISCAIGTSVIDAGRATITGQGQQLGSPEFLRNLEKLGYPPKDVREKQAQQAAEAYARFISTRVETLTGAKGIVNPDGSINCDKFRQLSNVNG